MITEAIDIVTLVSIAAASILGIMIVSRNPRILDVVADTVDEANEARRQRERDLNDTSLKEVWISELKALYENLRKENERTDLNFWEETKRDDRIRNIKQEIKILERKINWE